MASTKFTDEQLKQLGEQLLQSGGNVYLTARALFGEQPSGDEVFNELREIPGIFRCEHCSQWLDIAEEESEDLLNVCNDCVDEMNRDDDEEE